MNHRKIVFYVISLLIGTSFVLPALAATDCSGIIIDNDASDWEGMDALVTDGQDITGTSYYYDGSEWSTTESDDTLYSTNTDQMSDMETVKVCNTATQLQLYIDAFYPLLAYQELASGDYYEFGDGNGPDGELTLPANMDFWLVFKLQKVEASKIYYYVIYLRAAEGDLGLEDGPTQTAIYEESDHDLTYAEASFDPTADELLVEIPDDAETKSVRGEDGKQIDPSGGFETDVPLLDSDGNGLFNLTNIQYGDQLNISVETYDGGNFAWSPQVAEGLNDSTASARYRIRRTGVEGVVVPSAYRESNQVRVTWDTMDDASRYSVRLLSRTGRVISTTTTTKLRATLQVLTADHRYQVKVRAKVGDLFTAWSDPVSFRTAE